MGDYTSLESLLQLAPTGVNPFAFVEVLIEKALHPEHPPYMKGVLRFFGAVYVLSMIVCSAILIIPWCRGQRDRAKYQWLWKKLDIEAGSTPYHMPNGGLSMAILQLISSLISGLYVVMLYYSIDSPQVDRRSYGLIWADIRLLPMYLGFWLTAWASFAFSITSPRKTLSRHLSPKPVFFNAFCFLFAFIIVIFGIYFTVYQLKELSKSYALHDIFIEKLHYLGDQWNHTSGTVVLTNEIFKLEMAYKACALSTLAILVQTEKTGLFWAIAAAPVLAFYGIALWAFLTLLRGSAQIASGKVSVLDHHKVTVQDKGSSTPMDSVIVKIDSNRSEPQKRNDADNLARTYQSMAIRAVLLSTFLIYDLITAGIHLHAKHEALSDGKTRAMIKILRFSGSLPILFAMATQCYYLFTDPSEKTSGDHEK
ncbi:hypothetical protein CROQUDRAFT_663457 [Cronartium quercuum f. sp. fusiforme G11]|uniref:Uncharacterized protein n=1 Tax=Cronartium quercuum f. sp. fusiforme G11 TaxID=708437 RepID=A0A9P6NCM5_9BASI|nr:hypothetical protein CROQUDRAFT_663457 [Cronartium quercuum f. sp. fusiforme G11]